MTVAEIVRLFRDKRAVSAVISNLILIGAVIVVGFAVLFWTQYQSSTYNEQYSGIIGSDINQLQERINLEYAYYNKSTAPTNLRVYLLNSGTVNVTIQTVYVSNSTWSPAPFAFTLKNFTDSLVPSNTLNATIGTQEGCILISPISLANGGSYSIKIITARGSSFVYNFAT